MIDKGLGLFSQGGWMMLPLGLCSIVALAVVVDRLLFGPSRKRVLPQEFIETVNELLEKNKYEELLGVCKSNKSPLGRIVATALVNSMKKKNEILQHVEMAGRREAEKLTNRLGILGTIAAICPLLGLLGTVFGMISTFEVIQHQGVGNANALAGGIAEALITTAAGLSIAIPALVFYRAFIYQSRKLTAELEQFSAILVERIPCADSKLEEEKLVGTNA